MKTSKSPENGEVSPSIKKLKQARLPFKLISEVPSSPVTPQPRKRKLSAPDAVSATKIGKVCKENDLVEDLVVISDEDSRDDSKSVEEDKRQNPFVKLVDTAWKKKLQRAKKNVKKNDEEKEATETGEAIKKDVKNGPANSESSSDTNDVKVIEDSEMMDVDDASVNEANETDINTDSSVNKDTETKAEFSIVNVKSTQSICDTIDLEDSNNSSDVKPISQTNVTESTLPDNDDERNSSGKSNKDQNPEDSPEKDEPVLINPLTPRRSVRNKVKTEQNNSKSLSSSQANDSENLITPKHTRSLSVSSQDESLNESSTSTNLTPKQLQKKIESAKKRDEREKEKQERDRKKQMEKEERARQRQEKEDQRKKEREEKEDAKKREKEEKEEQKKKEREEKERQKELEKKLREEKDEQKRKEREEKEDQKRKEREAKEEEKRKKQEALELEKQEQELKKKKAAEAFVNFFVPKQKSELDQATIGPVSQNSMLSSFTIKVDMRLAPTIRVNLSEEKIKHLENLLQEQNDLESGLYLKCLKEGTKKPLSSGKTWPLSDKDDEDVMIVEDELPPTDGAGEIISCEPVPREKLRPKLLSFHENRRPPYWGTWRKKSASVKPRRPFGQDEKQVDYEADSDEEWEEEQEGESIDGSAAGSDEEQDADEYEVDNEVFVPHGYLSDEEATMDEDDVLSLSPDTQKARLKHLEDEFESEMKKPTEKLKPRLYGLLWETKDGGKPDKCVDAIWNYFGKLSMILNDPTPLLQPSNEPEESEKKKVKKKKAVNDGEQKSPKSDKKKKTKSTTKDSAKVDTKKNAPEMNNQPVINMFLKKFKST